METANPLQQLLLRGLGTTTLVTDRLRYVTQEWVSSGRLDASHASALVDDVLKALRGETPELEQQMGRNLERNRDNLLQDLWTSIGANDIRSVQNQIGNPSPECSLNNGEVKRP